MILSSAVSSTIANLVRSILLQDHTSDTGCTLKVIRQEPAKRLPGWNGMHRFIPALVLSAATRSAKSRSNIGPQCRVSKVAVASVRSGPRLTCSACSGFRAASSRAGCSRKSRDLATKEHKDLKEIKEIKEI